MDIILSLAVIRVIAFTLNVGGIIMAIVFGPPYLIMSSAKRAYLSGAEPNDPYIRKAALRDALSITGIVVFLAGLALHVVVNIATGPLYFHLFFKPNL